MNEIIDTEKNYIDALSMIITKFIVPLTSGNPQLLNEDEKTCIFFGIEVTSIFNSEPFVSYRLFIFISIFLIFFQKLYEIHSGIHEDLVKALSNDSDLKLYSVFFNWKEKLLLYGEFCANLTLAQHQIETVIRGSKVVADEIEVR